MPVHMADLGSDNYELEFTLGLIEGERALLQEIDEALERIRTGQYGICLATGKPIGKARLKAKPWAKFCYEHMLALEKGRQVRF
jgi:RNA polymerase-binding protein DksA